MGTDTDRHFIERMRWDEVARRIDDGAAAILPIGAAAKQHGFHLPLNTDRIQAEWLAGRLAAEFDALIWPTLSYGHYPAFVEYAGKQQPVGFDIRGARPRNRSGDSRQRMPEADRAQYRNQHVGAGRSRARASRRRPDQAFVDPRGPALSARGQGAGRAEPWQPCRRARNLVDAGDRAASGRHGARRSEPCPQTGRRRAH